MNIIVSSNGPTENDMVAKRLGHAPYHLRVDLTTRRMEVIDNRSREYDEHEIIARLVRSGVEVFVTGNIGPHAFRLIRSLGATVAQATNMSVREAVEKLQRDELCFLIAPTLKHSVNEGSRRTFRSRRDSRVR